MIHNPTSMTTCMTDHQKAFLYGARFGELAMFAVVLSKFISGPAPAAAYIAYAASVCIFLHGILRYLVTACVYHTEITASALGVTWTMVLIGTGTIYSCLYGSIWFVFVALLCALGLVKVVQAKGRIKEENAMTPGEKALHTRIQVGLFWIQLMLTLAMLTFRMLAGTKIGDYVATRGFGVCNTLAWRNGIFVVGALLRLIVMVYLSLRIYLWYRDDLKAVFSLPKGAV